VQLTTQTSPDSFSVHKLDELMINDYKSEQQL